MENNAGSNHQLISELVVRATKAETIEDVVTFLGKGVEKLSPEAIKKVKETVLQRGTFQNGWHCSKQRAYAALWLVD